MLNPGTLNMLNKPLSAHHPPKISSPEKKSGPQPQSNKLSSDNAFEALSEPDPSQFKFELKPSILTSLGHK